MSEILIKRTRDFYLYDQNGKRYVDCDLNNASAVLGHKPLQLNKKYKQTLDLGLSGSTRSRAYTRIINHLNNLIPEYTLSDLVYYYKNKERNSALFKSLGIEQVYDSLIENYNSNLNEVIINCKTQDAFLWRFFSQLRLGPIIKSKSNYLIVQVPIEWGDGILAIFTKTLANTREFPNIEISPIIIEGLNYIIPYLKQSGVFNRPPSDITKNRQDIFVIDLIDNAYSTKSNNNSSKRKNKSIFKEIALLNGWKKQGIYVCFPEYSYNDYEIIYQSFLESGFYFPVSIKEINYLPRYIALPPYLTKHEYEEWHRALSKINNL